MSDNPKYPFNLQIKMSNLDITIALGTLPLSSVKLQTKRANGNPGWTFVFELCFFFVFSQCLFCCLGPKSEGELQISHDVHPGVEVRLPRDTVAELSGISASLT